MLLACAIAEEDEFGFFAPGDVREPLSGILQKPCKPSSFARYLERLADESQGAVLQKHGSAGATRYRFVNPLLQPYVAMRGLSEGRVRARDLERSR